MKSGGAVSLVFCKNSAYTERQHGASGPTARIHHGRLRTGHHTNDSLLANKGLLVDHVLIHYVIGKEVEDRLRVRGIKLRLLIGLQRRSCQGQGDKSLRALTARGSGRPNEREPCARASCRGSGCTARGNGAPRSRAT